MRLQHRHRLDEPFRPARITDTPAGHAVCFGNAVDRNRPLGHARQRPQRDMFGPVIEDMFINLVGDCQDIIFLAQLGDELEVAARENAAGRVVRRVDDDGAGLVIERCR